MLIGAGLGALSSAAMGKSPFTGALMGGALGGLGGAGGLFGGAAGSGAGAAATAAEGGLLSSAAPVLGDAALISPFTPTGVAGIQTANASLSGLQPILGQAGEQAIAQGAPMYTGSQGMFDVAQGSTLGYNPSFLGGQGAQTVAGGGGYDPSFFGRLQEAGSNAVGGVKDMFGNMSTSDKLGLGLKGAEIAMQPTPPVQPASGVQPIQQKPFDPSSAIPASPSYGISKDEVAKGKVAQIASQARLNDEDKRRIGQFYQSLIG
jgi:hypothetical protein